ncbi:hypothetical protein LVJ94_35340 [Pendulispora rubella]|uniref:Uncharacterized protein n=1 Tax=Pendulispora rubella TaxID=2741070 RepID=A0ABZ2KU74_9BACT
MPISSTDIAQMTGAYQSVAMGNVAYSNMIGQAGLGAPAAYATHGDALMGGLANRGSAVGGPLALGGLGLLGLDPMSLGLRAGFGAFAGGAGLGGAALAAGAVALPAAAALAATQYAGSQMMSGIQQQATLNSTLRSAFSFPNGYGGQGFTRSDMTAVGSQLRQMSEHFGPAGEITSFRELTSLAGQMSQMGLAQGVRDVEDFSRRFRETISSLKQMASTLHTTLGEAMEFAASSKASGIFGMGRAASFATLARSATVSGGLGLSEVTSAAEIGSQIARSVGGLGRQGALGGVRTIGQIGTAEQIGVLSEEDIYNVTGLTGAEGRQAYAASSLQRTAGFLRTGRGRRLLASIAGKDGTLREDAVSELLSGGMSIGETMRLDRENLASIGRANFIRNEGRLRGAALERLGGFLPGLQLMEWARSKGIDIHDMDDRSMLFAGRQLGMGRDEVDQAIKMAQNMPRLIEEQRRSDQRDQYVQSLAQRRKSQGLEGVGQRFDQAREVINSKLQKIGQDVFNSGSEAIDEFFNKLFDVYVQTYSGDIDDAYRSVRSGGTLGRDTASRAFGIGGRGMNAYAASLGQGFRGAGAAAAPDLARTLSQGTRGGILESLASGQTLRYILGGQSAAGKLGEAGFNFSGMDSRQIEDKLRDIETARLALTGFDKGEAATGASNADWLRRAYAMGEVRGEGDLRLQSFGDLLERYAKSQPGAARLAQGWKTASTAEKSRMMANLERGAQIGDQAALSNHYGLPSGLGLGLERGGFASTGAENEAYAKAMGFVPQERHPSTATARPVTPSIKYMRPPPPKPEDSNEQIQAVGAFYKGAAFRDLAYGALSSDATERRAAERQIEDEIFKRKDDDPIRGELQKMLKYKMYSDRLIQSGGKLSDSEQSAIAKETGLSVDELRRGVGAMFGAVSQIQERDRREEARRVKEYAVSERTKLATLGVFDPGKGTLSDSGVQSLSKMSAGAREYVQKSLDLTNREYAGTGFDESAAALLQERGRALEGLSSSERRKVAQMFAGTDIGSEAGRAVAMDERFRALSRRRGAAGAAANILGVELSQADRKGLDLAGAGAAQLMLRAGISDESLVHELQSGAKTGHLAESLRRIVESSSYQKAQKERRMESAEERDPIAAAIKDSSAKSLEVLTQISKKIGTSNEALEKLTKGDPEDKKKP